MNRRNRPTGKKPPSLFQIKKDGKIGFNDLVWSPHENRWLPPTKSEIGLSVSLFNSIATPINWDT